MWGCFNSTVIAGYTLSYFAVSAMCDWDISPWYLLLAWIPSNIVGGMYTILLASVCYTSDVTTEKFRMRQLALLEASVSGGDLLAALIGPLIYEHFGCTNVFRTAAVCCATALLYIYFCLDESVKNVSKVNLHPTQCSVHFQSGIQIRYVNIFTEIYIWNVQTLFGQRPHNQRDGKARWLSSISRLAWNIDFYFESNEL